MRPRLIKIAAVAGVVLLFISVGMNVLLYNLALDYFRQSYRVRLDPLGLEAVPTTSVPVEHTNETIMFFGDSRALQWPEPDGLPQFTFINRGIGNQTSAQVAQRFDFHVRPLKPDILILQVCINDLKTIPLFPEDEGIIIDNCESNLKNIVRRARSMDMTIIVTTVFPVGEPSLWRLPVWSDEIVNAVVQVNTFIESLADDQVWVLDAYHVLADEHGMLRDDYRIDELHLNSAGYAALNGELVRLLDEKWRTHGTD